MEECCHGLEPACLVAQIPVVSFRLLLVNAINGISMFHRAFFNSIIDKHQHMHSFIQHYISLEC